MPVPADFRDIAMPLIFAFSAAAIIVTHYDAMLISLIRRCCRLPYVATLAAADARYAAIPDARYFRLLLMFSPITAAFC